MRHQNLSVQTLTVGDIKSTAGVSHIDRITALETADSAHLITATITLGTAAAGAQAATVQFKNAAGANVAYAVNFEFFLSGADTGLGIHANAADTLTASTGTIIKAHTAGLYVHAQTDATGKAVFAVASSTSARTYYAVVTLPSAKQIVSTAIIPTPSG